LENTRSQLHKSTAVIHEREGPTLYSLDTDHTDNATEKPVKKIRERRPYFTQECVILIILITNFLEI
jgi:hypothetical protein